MTRVRSSVTGGGGRPPRPLGPRPAALPLVPLPARLPGPGPPVQLARLVHAAGCQLRLLRQILQPGDVLTKLPGQSGEARIFLIQDDNLTAEVPLRRSILQSTLRQKYRSTGRHNPQRDGGPEKGLYRLHPIALRQDRAVLDIVLLDVGPAGAGRWRHLEPLQSNANLAGRSRVT